MVIPMGRFYNTLQNGVAVKSYRDWRIFAIQEQCNSSVS